MERHRIDHGPERKSCSMYVLEKNRQVCISDLGPIFPLYWIKQQDEKEEEDPKQCVDPLKEEKPSLKGKIEEGRDSD